MCLSLCVVSWELVVGRCLLRVVYLSLVVVCCLMVVVRSFVRLCVRALLLFVWLVASCMLLVRYGLLVGCCSLFVGGCSLFIAR